VSEINDVASSVRRLLARLNVQAVLFGLISTVVSWTPTQLTPTPIADRSWQFALAYSGVHHMAWGPGFDFTYGPLGFLTIRTLWFGTTAALSFAYLFLVQLTLFALLFRFTRSALPLWMALLTSYLIGATAISMVDPGDLIMAPTFLLGIMALRHQEGRSRRILLIILSSLAGAGFFIKFTDGLLATGIVLVVIAMGTGRDRVFDALIAAVSFIAVMMITWLATGNQIEDLPTYFKYSIAIASGYAGAMQVENGRTAEWWYAAVVLLIVALLAFRSLRSAGRRERLGTALLLAWYSWVVLKEGFVRHDASHDPIFFGLMLVTLVVFDLSLPTSRSLYLGAVAFMAAAAWIALGSFSGNLLGVASDTHGFGDQLLTILDSQRRESTVLTGRAILQYAYRLPEHMVTEVAGHTVAIEPAANAVAWAYPSMHWDPEPVLQTYSAYTSSLDALDSNFIASTKAPSRILENPTLGTIDGRDAFFESPTAYVTILCHYVELDAEGGWQLLERVPDRCGATTFMGSVKATVGMPVTVPAAPPGSMVTARFGLSLPVAYDVSSIALKAPYVTFSAWGPREHPAARGRGFDRVLLGHYRFIAATAGDLHLLRPSSSTAYSPPHGPTTVSSFVLSGGDLVPGISHYVVRFYSIPIADRSADP
jgi:hypothetical protein